MKIDQSKLKHVTRTMKPEGMAIVAQCPACVEEGTDNSGNHLIIYPDGRFGCAVNQGNTEHRRRIFALVGVHESPAVPKMRKASVCKPVTVEKRIWYFPLSTVSQPK